MANRSKREVAPPPPSKEQCSIHPMHPGIPFSNPYWMASQPQVKSAPNAHGIWSSAAPTVDVHGVPPAAAMDGFMVCPPGGFVNFLQNGLLEPIPNLKTHHDASDAKAKHDNDDVDVARTEKRLPWTKEEDVRLVSTWLNNSNDPIKGNSKKNEQYWFDVHRVYHLTTPANRSRKVKHLKDRHEKIKRLVGFYCGSWKKANAIYTSGQSDD